MTGVAMTGVAMTEAATTNAMTGDDEPLLIAAWLNTVRTPVDRLESCIPTVALDPSERAPLSV